MAQSSRTFRVFISSTFSDFKLERSALQQRVFPDLRALAQEHGCRFQAIDLRWGVSEEAALDQQTMKICLAEITRCQQVSPRPNFIILLGQRVGWRPLPYAIPENEFERLRPFLAPDEATLACWREDGSGWYRLDHNADPPEYLLQLRRKGSQWEDYEAWEAEVERPLVAALESAAIRAGLSADAMVKYSYSATGQEIVHGALSVESPERHVFAYFREIENLPSDQAACEYTDPDPAAIRRQKALKQQTRDALGGNIRQYQTSWTGRTLAPHYLDDLCHDVYADLSRIMLAEIASLEGKNALEKELETQFQFLQDRTRVFEGRAGLLQAINAYIESGPAYPLVISGPSGSGKSALMARAVELAQASNPIYRFIGASPESFNIKTLLSSLCTQAARVNGLAETDLPEEYLPLVQKFYQVLADAGRVKPIVLFLDALDQLSGEMVDWLEAQLPPGVCLIVSTLPGVNLENLRARLPAEAFLDLQPMLDGEGGALLDRWLGLAHRRLTAQQRDDIMGKFSRGGGLPLFLKLAFEEARRWYSYDGLMSGVGETVEGVIHDLLRQLEQESSHGQMLVEHALGLLAAAKNGLSEDELLDVLWTDPAVQANFFQRSPHSPRDIQALPVVIWSRLFLDLEPYLAWRQTDGAHLLTFYHRSLREIVEARYLSGSRRVANHRSLAVYFGSAQKPYWLKRDSREPDRRKTAEIIYQAVRAGLADETKTILSDYEFVSARLYAAGPTELLGDYDIADPLLQNSALRAIRDSLQLSAHILKQDPQQLIFQLWGRMVGLPDPEVKGLLKQAAAFMDRPWARPDVPCLNTRASNLVMMFDGNFGNQRHLSADGRSLFAMHESSFSEWNLRTGEHIRNIRNNDQKFAGGAFSTDGSSAVTVTFAKDPAANVLQVWDLRSGTSRSIQFEMQPHWSFSTPQESISCNEMAVSNDGRFAVTIFWDFYDGSHPILKIWDLQSGNCLKTIRYAKLYNDSMCCLRITPESQAVVLISRRVDVAIGFEVKRIPLQSEKKPVTLFKTDFEDQVIDIALTQDGTALLSAMKNATITLRDLKNGRLLHTFDTDGDLPLQLIPLPDGQRFVSFHQHGKLCCWALAGRCLESGCYPNVDPMSLIGATPDGQTLISGNAAKLIVWDLSKPWMGEVNLSAKKLQTDFVAISQDGEIAVTRSEIEHPKYERATTKLGRGRIYQHERTSNSYVFQIWKLNKSTAPETLDGNLPALISRSSKQMILNPTMTSDSYKVIDLEGIAAVRTIPNFTMDFTDFMDYYSSADMDPVTLAMAEMESGTRLALIRDDGFYSMSLENGSISCLHRTYPETIEEVAISPDGHQVVAYTDYGGYQKGTLKVFNLLDGSCETVLNNEMAIVHRIYFSPSGERVILYMPRINAIQTWNLASRSLEHEIKVDNMWGDLRQTNERMMALVEGTIQIRDSVSSQPIATCLDGEKKIESFTLSPDGRFALARFDKRTLKCWDMERDVFLWAYTFDSDLFDFTFLPESGAFLVLSLNRKLSKLRLEGISDLV